MGHLLLHRHVSAAEAATPALHKVLENQAHRFASALLLPAESFSDEVYSLSLEALLHVKSRWRVSVQTMLRRARTLELVSQDKYERAFRDLSRRGYRKREPLDDVQPVEVPQVLARSIQMMLDERVTTRDALMHQLPYSHDDVEVLACLPRGFLEASTWGELAELKLRATPVESAPTDGGKLLPFKPRAP
jgi:Zn-dependent peptidase ImmA (M78 family)